MGSNRARRIRSLLVLGLTTFLLQPGLADSSQPLDGSYVFHWRADDHRAITEYSSHVNRPFVVEFLGQDVELPDASAAQSLLREHDIVLSDEEAA